MSGSYYTLNSKYNQLKSILAGLPISGSGLTGDLDANNFNILNVNDIDLTTINGAAYPPPVAASDLDATLTVGNSAGTNDIDMNSNKIVNTLDPVNLQDVATKNYIDSILGGYMKQVKVERFTTSGTWTVPAGATYAVAHILGGGGGTSAPATAGGDSSVAFTSGTITALGGNAWNTAMSLDFPMYAVNGMANSGQGGIQSAGRMDNPFNGKMGKGQDGVLIVAGADVVAATSIAVVVGLGGTAGIGGGVGGSGYVWIEYY